jgi:glucokinase
MQKLILAADLGGTNMRMAVVSPEGDVIHRARRATPNSGDKADVVEALVEIATECIAESRQKGEVVSFGVAVPAVVDSKRGAILSAPNLPELDGFALASELSARLSIPVSLENDATAAAIGEHWLGNSREFNNIIHVTLGTGVGGGIILNGEPLRGVDGTAGEIGHICVEPEGHPCGCGSRGCVEQYSSGSAIVRLASEQLSSYPDSSLTICESLTSQDVFNAGVEGDALATQVFETMGTYLGIALAGLINVLNPEAIVIGGGVSNGWDLFIDRVRNEIRERAFQRPAERVTIVRASLGDDAGTLGVAFLAIQEQGRSIQNSA